MESVSTIFRKDTVGRQEFSNEGDMVPNGQAKYLHKQTLFFVFVFVFVFWSIMTMKTINYRNHFSKERVIVQV